MANPLRPALLAAARSPRVRRAVTRTPATRSLVERFVAGTTTAEAVATAAEVLSSGRAVTIDHLGEDTTDLAQAEANTAEYLTLLAALPRSVGPLDGLEVSLKLSALGQSLPRDGHKTAQENAHAICAAAQAAGALVTIDAEDHTTTDSTLSVVRELRADFPTLGAALQAHLKRTEADCRDLSGPGSRIRLCKGAYREPASVAHQDKAAVDEAYLRCLRVLMDGDGHPMVATHDPAMIAAATRLALPAGRSTRDLEFQMLYGIRDAEQRRLVEDRHTLRVYLPYGGQWYGYFMRRLAERPANLTFFLRSLISRD
ncbi:proline dehydrogenase family protein [Actinokineospora pegani]|uniref:proline dehydrogenase family protein n=1 Tax=Actinokineospora pegani TaxID=2654637 RepID=UPI0012EAE9FC|nr:proline dehydrogenase family protein [Actinokineospora pegani]